MDKATVVIIDHSPGSDLRERLSRLPDIAVVGCTDNPDIGFTMVERYQPALVLLNIDWPGDKGVSLAESLALEFPMSSLILLSSSDSKRVFRIALQAGARDIISLPVDDPTLFRTVGRALQQHFKRKSALLKQRERKPQFKTIAILAMKGGVGRTTVALNLAIAIRNLTQRRVAAVDLDLRAGNLALMAGVSPRYSIKDVVDDMDNLDKEALDAYLAEHPSGIKILPAPLESDFAEYVQAEHVEKMLELMSQVYNYIVVDTPAYVHDTVVPVLEASDDIVLLTTMDLAAIQNLKRCMDLLARLSMRQKARLVINRVGYTGGLKIKDIEDEFGIKVQCTIPNQEKAAVDAVNMGNPLYLLAGNSQVARRFDDLAGILLGDSDGTQLRAQAWGTLRGKPAGRWI